MKAQEFMHLTAEMRDEIASLRSKLAIAEKALEPFATFLHPLMPGKPDDEIRMHFSRRDFEAARAALTAIREGRE